MRMYLGEHVLSREGQDAGIIDKVIVDPEHDRVMTVVLREGNVFHHDVEVTLDQLSEGPDGRLRLSLSLDQLQDLPRFVEGSYTLPPPDTVFPAGYPAGSVLWPGWWGEDLPPRPRGVPYGGDLKRSATIHPPPPSEQAFGNPILGPGSAIYSREGHKVGELERLVFDQDGQLGRLIVRQGLLFPKEVELPGALVERAADDGLYLTVDRERVAKMADEERRKQ